MQYFIALGFFWIFLLPLCADNKHLELKNVPYPILGYTVKDLGTTDLTLDQLSKLESIYPLAPSLNNRGQVVYNKKDGAFFRDPNIGEYALSKEGIRVYGHAINNKGDLLVSLNRASAPGEIEWMVWSQTDTHKPFYEGIKLHLANLDKNERVFFNAMNDCGVVVGYKEIKEKLHPILWTCREGVHLLGYNEGFDIAGFPQAINNQGAVAGYFEDCNDSPPFIWKRCSGLELLRNYRDLIGCAGWVELADMVITHCGVIYGTYLVKYVSSHGNQDNLNQYFIYRWEPETGNFQVSQVKGMRLAAINNANVMVGSLNGRAALYREGQPPVDLNSLLPDSAKGWVLLEASDINDLNQIVGYGTFNGETHIFLFETLWRE